MTAAPHSLPANAVRATSDGGAVLRDPPTIGGGPPGGDRAPILALARLLAREALAAHHRPPGQQETPE